MMKEKIKVHHRQMKAGVIALINDLQAMGYDVKDRSYPIMISGRVLSRAHPCQKRLRQQNMEAEPLMRLFIKQSIDAFSFATRKK
jgi:hypothetical protein